MIVVPDAGPLSYLAGAGKIELLRVLYADVVVPRVVYDEVTVAGAGMTGSAEVAPAHWIRVVEQAPDAALLDRLDVGEAAAIPLAAALGAILLVDDCEARTVAGERGIPVIGSLGVLLGAKQRGHLAAVRPVLERMVELGMFVSPALRTRVLVLAGEVDEGS